MDIIATLRRARTLLDAYGANAILSDIDAAIAELTADPQSAAEPAREREPDPLLAAFAPWDDDAWNSIADTEAF